MLLQVGELVEENVEDQLDVANKKDYEKLKTLGTATSLSHPPSSSLIVHHRLILAASRCLAPLLTAELLNSDVSCPFYAALQTPLFAGFFTC